MTVRKTESELITTVANITDLEGCRRFGQRANEAGMAALAAACEERAKTLGGVKASRTKNAPSLRGGAAVRPMKTHIVAEQALAMLIEDYAAGLPPTTYGELARRCGFEGQQNGRWFGQVTDLIDAACALAGVPSFALVRVREANGNVNVAAWSKGYSHLRDRIIAKALAGKWTDQNFIKIKDALAIFSARCLGNKKAWEYVICEIHLDAWAGEAE